MSRWVIILVSNKPHIHRAFETIRQCRTTGKWEGDIVLLTSEDCINDASYITQSQNYNVELREVPNINYEAILDCWNRDKGHYNYEYISTRLFQHAKYYVMDKYFKKWDFVFYMDSGCYIMGPLDLFKSVCIETNCLYAHADGYPYYNWKLAGQFADTLLTKNENDEFHTAFPGLHSMDYFQTTSMIFHTSIIEETTVQDLFNLMYKYPHGTRGDQPIFNLLFVCIKNIWKQMPVCHNGGFLYDFMPRHGNPPQKYILLKRDFA